MSIRMRHTKGHTGNRRSHHALQGVRATKDTGSGNFRLAHHIDELTGMYRGKQIAKVKVKRAREVVETKTKGHEHANTQATSAHNAEGSRGIVGKIAAAVRPKSRSGMGGGA